MIDDVLNTEVYSLLKCLACGFGHFHCVETGLADNQLLLIIYDKHFCIQSA